MRRLVIGVGSNLGAREAAIRCASELLSSREEIRVRALSTIYETEPLGPPQPQYLNAAFLVESDLPAPGLLDVLLRIERRLGRRRQAGQRWGPRSIDLDLLWDERGAYESSELHLPHAELRNRDFALTPLLDVAPFLAEEYGASLEGLGGAPPIWGREAIVRTQDLPGGVEVEVEADSLADACALSLGTTLQPGRPWSTRHARIDPDPEPFAQLLREFYRTGFSPRCASVSKAGPSQWSAEFHGVNVGMPVDADVRLCTTSGARRAVRARLRIDSSTR